MQRPTSVTVFGILNIVFAVFGFFGLMASVAVFTLLPDLNNPLIKLVHESPGFALWIKISIGLGAVSNVALLATGIGLLCVKSWARVLALGYAVYAIIFTLVALGMNVIFMVGPMLEQARRESGPAMAGAVGGAIGGVIGGMVGLIYPVLLLIFMTRPKVVAAFRAPVPSAL